IVLGPGLLAINAVAWRKIKCSGETNPDEAMLVCCERSGLHGSEPRGKPVAPWLGTSLNLLQDWGHCHMSPDCHSYELFSPLIPR
ncbi:unnamed protein product, partial [Bubo scandiacus]